MGFLDTLRGLTVQGRPVSGEILREFDALGGADDDATSAGPADPAALASPVESSAYDRNQWRKKLQHILDKLPASEPQWGDLEQEAGALGFDPAVVAACYREELAMMIRKIVSDQVVTGQEHRKLDLARQLMGIADAEADRMLKDIVTEAEAFFGKSVEGA